MADRRGRPMQRSAHSVGLEAACARLRELGQLDPACLCDPSRGTGELNHAEALEAYTTACEEVADRLDDIACRDQAAGMAAHRQGPVRRPRPSRMSEAQVAEVVGSVEAGLQPLLAALQHAGVAQPLAVPLPVWGPSTSGQAAAAAPSGGGGSASPKTPGVEGQVHTRFQVALRLAALRLHVSCYQLHSSYDKCAAAAAAADR